MKSEQIIYRKATIKDTGDIFRLYKLQSKISTNSTRDETEITKKQVEDFTLRSLKNSSQFVAVDPLKEHLLIGEIHCYKLDPKAYSHMLTDLTMAIHPEYNGTGLEQKLVATLLSNIIQNRADIWRIELMIAANNTESINHFKEAGFIVEGKLENRIRKSGQAEAEIAMAWFNPKFRR